DPSHRSAGPPSPDAIIIQQTAAQAGGDVGRWLQAAQAARHAGQPEQARTMLTDAARRFPDNAPVRHDLARAAEAVGDWQAAEGAWHAFAVLRPAVWWGPANAALALRRQGRMQQAEALLAQACGQFPNDPGPFIEHARQAELQGDWDEAGARWAAVIARFPQSWDGLAGHARVLRTQGQPDAARAVLIQALEKFPSFTSPLHDLARLAEWRRDWTAAERWWRLWVAFEPDRWFGHAGLANALREQGQGARAAAVLAAQFDRFGHEPGFFIECGKLSERSADWRAAAERWAAIRNRFPNDWPGYGAQARALREMGRPSEADALVATAAQQFPEQTELLQELALAAEHGRDWATAEAWWRSFLQRNTQPWEAYIGLAGVLREQRRHDEAAGALAEALDRFPHSPDALIAIVGQISQPGTSLPDARLDTLEHLFAEHANQPDPPRPILLASALIARERRDWDAYRRRLEVMAASQPNDPRVRILLAEAKELAPEAAAATTTPAAVAEDTELALSFESLGGGRAADGGSGGDGGCEFGFFQRSLHAEPLSLLRWATIQPPDLLRGLADGFGALDRADTVELRPQAHYDWQVREHHYNIQIDHTHLDREKVDIAEAQRMVRKRFVFLRRKLIDDLALGEKIFVYRLADRSIMAEQIEELAQAVNQYGRNTLLFVVRNAAQTQPFCIERQREGLIVASIAPSPLPEMPINHHAWLELCRFARAVAPAS
ncbi:MAG TPA: tetratricopeptide repeat protein, partial [Rhodopila sp.]